MYMCVRACVCARTRVRLRVSFAERCARAHSLFRDARAPKHSRAPSARFARTHKNIHKSSYKGHKKLTRSITHKRDYRIARILARGLSFSLSLSLSHTHTHTLTHSLSLSLSLSLTLSLSLSLSHTHTHTNTQFYGTCAPACADGDLELGGGRYCKVADTALGGGAERTLCNC